MRCILRCLKITCSTGWLLLCLPTTQGILCSLIKSITYRKNIPAGVFHLVFTYCCFNFRPEACSEKACSAWYSLLPGAISVHWCFISYPCKDIPGSMLTVPYRLQLCFAAICATGGQCPQKQGCSVTGIGRIMEPSGKLFWNSFSIPAEDYSPLPGRSGLKLHLRSYIKQVVQSIDIPILPSCLLNDTYSTATTKF